MRDPSTGLIGKGKIVAKLVNPTLMASLGFDLCNLV
jgi:hypothetical protein